MGEVDDAVRRVRRARAHAAAKAERRRRAAAAAAGAAAAAEPAPDFRETVTQYHFHCADAGARGAPPDAFEPLTPRRGAGHRAALPRSPRAGGAHRAAPRGGSVGLESGGSVVTASSGAPLSARERVLSGETWNPNAAPLPPPFCSPWRSGSAETDQLLAELHKRSSNKQASSPWKRRVEHRRRAERIACLLYTSPSPRD